MKLDHRRGLFFLIDAALAVIALLIGSILIFSAYFTTPSVTQMDILASSVAYFYTNVSTQDYYVNSLNLTGLCETAQACNQKDFPMTYGEFVYRLYESYQRGNIEGELVSDVLRNLTVVDLPAQIDINILINGTTFYNSSDISVASVVIPARTLLSYIDNSSQFHKPISFEVLLW